MKKIHPVEIKFSEEAYAKLLDLKKRLSVSSKTEVIRLALATLAWVTEELEEEHEILVSRKSGEATALSFPLLKIKRTSGSR